jgi:AraC-like DNA-binding protein
MLAELTELSPFHFSRVFKQSTGMTPLQFVIRERMEIVPLERIRGKKVFWNRRRHAVAS